MDRRSAVGPSSAPPTSGNAINALITFSTLADTDGDGMPDVWENAYFGGPTAAQREDDSDGDGMKNWQEYIAGTNPTNALSYLKIDQLGAPGAALAFLAVTQRTYTVQFTDALGSPWQKLADVVARATNRTEAMVDPDYTTNRFYRLATPQQP